MILLSFVQPGSGGLDEPQGMSLHSDGNLYVASAFSHSVIRYNGQTGEFIDVFASGGGLANPVRAVFGPDGHLYVSGNSSNNVVRYDGTTGAFINVFIAPGTVGLEQPTWLLFIAPAPGDCDDDGDVDLDDYGCFFDCVTGSGGGLLPGCGLFDFDADLDVDLLDFGAFQNTSGS